MAWGTDETDTSKLSRVLVTGNAAAFMRPRALEASREAISASTNAARSCSGFQRWMVAVTSSSGARARMAESRRRRSPASRSADSGGGGGHGRPPMA